MTPHGCPTWLASWTVSYFDAIATVRVMAVVQDAEAGANAFAAALEACRVQTLGVLNQRLARLTCQMEALMNVFPGATVCNTECVRFVEDVQRRVSPEVARRLVEHFAEWLVQACAWDHAEARRAPRDSPTVHPPGEDTGTGSTIVPRTAPPAASPVESAAPSPREAPDEGTSVRKPSTVAVQDDAWPRSWDAVEIRFVSDFTFQAVVNGTVRAPQNYAEVGLGDGRHGGRRPPGRPCGRWRNPAGSSRRPGRPLTGHGSRSASRSFDGSCRRSSRCRTIPFLTATAPIGRDSRSGSARPTPADRRSGEISPAASNFFFTPTSRVRSVGSETFRRRKVVARRNVALSSTEHFNFRGGPHDIARAP